MKQETSYKIDDLMKFISFYENKLDLCVKRILK